MAAKTETPNEMVETLLEELGASGSIDKQASVSGVSAPSGLNEVWMDVMREDLASQAQEKQASITQPTTEDGMNINELEKAAFLNEGLDKMATACALDAAEWDMIEQQKEAGRAYAHGLIAGYEEKLAMEQGALPATHNNGLGTNSSMAHTPVVSAAMPQSPAYEVFRAAAKGSQQPVSAGTVARTATKPTGTLTSMGNQATLFPR